MKRGTIKIENNRVRINGDIWLAEFEIAELFGVRYGAVRGAIKTVFKSGTFSEYQNMRYEVLESGNRADLYNIGVITAVAFLLHTPPAQVYRNWIISRLTTKEPLSTPPILINLGNGTYMC